MKTKIKRRNFCFTAESDRLISELSKKTELSYTVLVRRGLELLAKKEGILKD